jgi:superfamily I DNA and/or RNA helicase
VNGREEQQPRGFSYANRIEADIVIEYANLFIQKGIPPDEIGIISPYRWQTKIIGDKMAQHPNARSLQKITIDSVERFQVRFIWYPINEFLGLRETGDPHDCYTNRRAWFYGG